VSRAEILRNTPLRALLAAEVISTTGSQMTWLALPWFVLVTTHSPARMTLVMIAELVGLTAAGLPSGAILQRLGARRTMLWADAVRAPLMLLVPVLHSAGHLSFGMLIALSFALGTFGAPYFAAQRLIVPELLGEDESVVTQANALFQGAIRVTMLLGPPIGGVLIGLLGAPSVLLVDAASYAISFTLVLLFVPRRAPVPAEENARGLLSGVRFLMREPLLRVWIPLFVVGDAAWQAFFAAVPVLVVERFDADAKIAGILFAGFGAGAVAGNIASFRFLSERIEGLRLIALSVPFQALPLWILPLDVGAPVLVAAIFASGIANGICNPTIHATWTLRMPPAIRAKALTASMTIWGLGVPLGLVVAGPVLSAYGARPVLVGFAAVQTAAMLGIAAASLRARMAVPDAMLLDPGR
jgi:predicted MFS family arabinose efflux permease